MISDEIRLLRRKDEERGSVRTDDVVIPDQSRMGRLTRILLLVAAVAMGIYYFAWLLNPDRVETLALFIALVTADLFNFSHAITFWILLSVRHRHNSTEHPPKTPLDPSATVDIFVPTLNESREVLERTLRSCAAVRWPKLGVYVLDDGARDWVKALADELSIGYLRRHTNRGAKAGNINDALRETCGDFVLVFDADHAPGSDFLERTMPEFADPRVAVVQTPQVYGNLRESTIAFASKQQQDLFYQTILPGKDGLGGTFSCGTNVIYRRTALEDVNGVAEDSIVEDMKTSMLLHARGWRMVYVHENLAVGLGPVHIQSFWRQQRRWASGCLGLLASRALWTPRLSPAKKWHYLTSLSYFASGWPVLTYSILPILRLFFGWSAVDRHTDEFVLRFAPYFGLSLLILGVQMQGRYGFQGLLMHWGSFSVHIVATWDAVFSRHLRFRVTPKSLQEGSHLRYLWPNLLIVLLSGAAIIYGLAGDMSPSTINNAAFAVFNAVVVGGIIVLAYQKQGPAVELDQVAHHRVRAPVQSPETSIQ